MSAIENDMENLPGGGRPQIPIFELDLTDLATDFKKNSMELFHANQIKINQLQGQTTSSSNEAERKEFFIKTHQILTNVTLILNNMGVSCLSDQLVLIFKQLARLFFQKKIQLAPTPIKTDLSNQNLAELFNKTDLLALRRSIGNASKYKQKFSLLRMRGVSLYNQNFTRNIDKKSGVSKRLQDMVETRVDSEASEKNIQIQEFNYFMNMNKHQPFLNIKNHSSQYFQIENECLNVHNEIEKVMSGLQKELNGNKLKSYENLYRHEINLDLHTYKQNYEDSILHLKQRSESLVTAMAEEMKVLRGKVDAEAQRRTRMVGVEVQTQEAYGYAQKLAKATREYQEKVKELEAAISEGLVKQEQLQQRIKTIIIEKEKEIVRLQQQLALSQQNAQRVEAHNQYLRKLHLQRDKRVSKNSRASEDETTVILSKIRRLSVTKVEPEEDEIKLRAKLNYLNRRDSRTSFRFGLRGSQESNSEFLEKLADNRFDPDGRETLTGTTQSWKFGADDKRRRERRSQIVGGFSSELQSKLYRSSSNKNSHCYEGQQKGGDLPQLMQDSSQTSESDCETISSQRVSRPGKQRLSVEEIQKMCSKVFQQKDYICNYQQQQKKQAIQAGQQCTEERREDYNSKETKKKRKSHRISASVGVEILPAQNSIQAENKKIQNNLNFLNVRQDMVEADDKSRIQSTNNGSQQKLKQPRQQYVDGSGAKPINRFRNKSVADKPINLIKHARKPSDLDKKPAQALLTSGKRKENKKYEQITLFNNQLKSQIGSRQDTLNPLKQSSNKHRIRQLKTSLLESTKTTQMSRNQPILQEDLAQQFVNIKEIAESSPNVLKFKQQIKKIHSAKCNLKECHHLDRIARFFRKHREQLNRKPVLKMHLENMHNK